ncbi:CoA transferase [Modestobacter sp. I12A-02628]|uniref:CoA transferase n=1 Tax=Goekera deserti TaxID=2497753 RepID=A0A7K3WD81_9ACTN|nr:CoA transferase [Goekera deserti]MPQ96937.1 CoA transferase [Goekera deserti]NDI46748.1 CoA transferase [Goekera deserti]NEL54317.1 CoA transferase [Goekera deserti]
MTSSTRSSSPDLLTDLRVVDLTSAAGRLTTRLLADLGADVVRVDHGDVDATDLHRLAFDANKRSVRLDPSDDGDRQRLLRLIATAGILVEDGRPGELAAAGLTEHVLQQVNPRLVVLSLSAFGQDGPYRDWAGTEWVQLALGGVLARSGLPGIPPVLPPGELATQSAAVQGAWAALVGWYHAAVTGAGEHVDVSVLEATAGVLDPGFGMGGSATGGVPAKDGPRGRPDARHLYPVFACADGHVRICLLAPRQWRGMRAWLGEPEEFADPALEQLGKRFAAAGQIYPYIAERFAGRTREELMAAGMEHGFPIAGLLTLHEVLQTDHFSEVAALVDVPVEGLGTIRLPNGFVTVDGERAGLRHPAPLPGADDALLDDLTAATVASTGSRSEAAASPLQGLRVLDLGVIVVGAETGRLLADMGAEVVKIESAAFPDGARQSFVPGPISATFAYGHRGKLSLGLDLRSDEGKDLFRRLVRVSDVVLSNFKPGTMESLGFSHEALAAINPGIVTAESSAFGPSGPWSRRMGYGPLVRASAGLTDLWAYPDRPDSWSDASTIYPDHTAARIQALTVLAALARRRRTGRGAHISSSQADTILGQLAPALARESLAPGSVRCTGNVGAGDAPRGIHPCAGDDEWLVVDVRGDADWACLAAVVGRPELAVDPRFATARDRVLHRAEVDELVGAWTALHPPREAMTLLQAGGVPAGAMLRVPDLPEDPQLQARGFLAVQPQPQLGGPLLAEARHAHFGVVPDPELRPGPLLFEHTRDVAHRVLGLDAHEIERLAAAGVLQVADVVPAMVG